MINNFLHLIFNQQLTLPLFFAAVSAGGIAAPLIASPYGYGHGYGYSAAAPLSYAHAAPLAYSSHGAYASPYSAAYASPYSYGHAPVIKAVAPVAYAAPVVKHVVPAATSYANTYKVSLFES